MAGWRGPPPRAPGHAGPTLRGLGLTRPRRCRGIPVPGLAAPGRVRHAHGTAIPPALESMSSFRVLFEDVCPVGETQGLHTLDLACPPGNPQDGGPAIGLLVLRSHSSAPSFGQNTGGETPASPGEGAPGVEGSFSPGSPLPYRPVPAWGAAPEASTKPLLALAEDHYPGRTGSGWPSGTGGARAC